MIFALKDFNTPHADAGIKEWNNFSSGWSTHKNDPAPSSAPFTRQSLESLKGHTFAPLHAWHSGAIIMDKSMKKRKPFFCSLIAARKHLNFTLHAKFSKAKPHCVLTL